MPASTTLPASNPGGNNQTSPGVGGAITAPTPVFTPTAGAGTLPSANPYVGVAPTSTPPAAGTGLYNTASSQGSGETDISKQLRDIAGKGVGGSLNKLLSSLSGVDSQVFQQWLAAQVPAQASEEARMRGGLGAMGVSGNSSVMGLAEANLGAQFNAQAAAENAALMTQNIGTTTNVLQGMQGAAEKEVASSGWQVFGNVLGQLGSDAATLFSGTDLSGMFGGGSANYAHPGAPSELG